jgi:hypothetical protein
MFKTVKLNNEKVRAVEAVEDTRPVKGAALFPDVYCNGFFCAKTKKGKTAAMFKSLQRCCGKNTKIIAFCSTLNWDPAWTVIQEWAAKKGIPFVGHLSIKEGKVDRLADFIKDLEKPEEEEPEEEPDSRQEKNFFDSDSEIEEEEKPRPRKPKYQTPEYIFILDDLSRECRLPSVSALLKKSRHFKSKVFISSQHPNDLQPEARTQLGYWILFKDHSRKKIDEIHASSDISLEADDFYRVYQFATEEPYSFLYIDKHRGTFRRNFNTLIEVE